MHRLLTAVATLAVVVALASGCTTPGTPEPTPVFTSEQEAFAAAEATYRAYVDALNQVDLSNPETFEDVYRWTTGDANAGARETFSQMHADGWVVSGETVIDVAQAHLQSSENLASVLLDVCQDVSEVTVVDSEGESVVAPDRPDVQTMRVDFELAESSPTGLLISSFSAREDGPSCG